MGGFAYKVGAFLGGVVTSGVVALAVKELEIGGNTGNCMQAAGDPLSISSSESTSISTTSIVEDLADLQINSPNTFDPWPHIIQPSHPHRIWTKLAQVYGYPSSNGSFQKICGNFALEYCPERRNPRWVFEHFDNDNWITNKRGWGWPKKVNFFTDPTLDKDVGRSEREMRKGTRSSGRTLALGHLAPAKNHRDSYENYKMTFVLSNIVPQELSVNEGVWKEVEDMLPRLCKEYKTVGVFTGPVFHDHDMSIGHENNFRTLQTNAVVGPSSKPIIVPQSFFKIYVCETEDGIYDLWVFKVPNSSEIQNLFLISNIQNIEEFTNIHSEVNTIRKYTGLQLLKKIDSKQFRNCNGGPCFADPASSKAEIQNFVNKKEFRAKLKQARLDEREI